ncbi:MAG: ammonia-forming cytochrome c nitrite reductase [Bacteroidales bacterium]|jgi:nitrite reductase (cytochrome c-552)|nr:ammonia-forming cytochrome c nitrite reductase [Bacteroidales bacterium]
METTKHKPVFYWMLFIATVIVVFFLGMLASSITNRRAEREYVFKPMVELKEGEPRNAEWGKNYPREYQSYIQTRDTGFMSKYNGNARIDMLEVDPRMVVLWAGYAFSKDYTQGRGHYYAVDDIVNSLRTGAPSKDVPSPQPNTCWTCKSPDVTRLLTQMSPAEFYRGSWDTKGAEIVNPIGCADCHDPSTMNLVITRPALIEAFQRQGKDISKATQQEMRSLVCGQCHVEYYFDKKKIDGVAYLAFPWDNGFSAEAIEKYYDDYEFTDWTHALSRAPMLKAQHPEYETWMMGIHSQRGVSCADCHMPYKSEGGQKYTDHHIQSPLNNVANSCQVCHREETATLVTNVYDRQDKIIENRDKLEELLVRAHVEAKKAWDLGASEAEMKPVLLDIRKAQWRWDFAAASHGASFHAPLEIGRVISGGIALAQEARISLARVLAAKGYSEAIPYPDISTKAKAQKFIGLDIEKLNAEKETFKRTMAADWLKEARQREAGY